tara:strand:+ start:1886 stop:2149 length:264 start_codon:yes stop_codon:yes gene_type:complete
MYKFVNLFIFLLIFTFFLSIYKYYSSSKNIYNKNFNRANIDEILKEKIIGIPVLTNDTNNVIEFNDTFKEDNSSNKKRSFWDLLEKK